MFVFFFKNNTKSYLFGSKSPVRLHVGFLKKSPIEGLELEHVFNDLTCLSDK